MFVSHVHSRVSLQYHLASMEATIFHHKFSILGRLHKLSSLPPPPVSRCNRTAHTLHQALAPTTITQQPTAPHLHCSSLHPHLEQPVLPSPHTHNSLKSFLALPHPQLFLPHHYQHSRLPLSLQHLTFYRLRPHLSHQCRHQSQQVAPAVGIVVAIMLGALCMIHLVYRACSFIESHNGNCECVGQLLLIIVYFCYSSSL